jgi:hypothetical protein
MVDKAKQGLTEKLHQFRNLVHTNQKEFAVSPSVMPVQSNHIVGRTAVMRPSDWEKFGQKIEMRTKPMPKPMPLPAPVHISNRTQNRYVDKVNPARPMADPNTWDKHGKIIQGTGDFIRKERELNQGAGKRVLNRVQAK